MIPVKLIPCESDDPNRCQGVEKSGQCKYAAHGNSKFCLRHGGNKAVFHDKVKRANMYRLQVWQKRLDEFAEAQEATNLKSEIGILRVTLEALLNKCTDSTQLILYSNKISDLAVKIEKLIASSQRIEKTLGTLLDKTAILNFAEEVVAIIGKHIEDSEVIDDISNGIIDALNNASK